MKVPDICRLWPSRILVVEIAIVGFIGCTGRRPLDAPAAAAPRLTRGPLPTKGRGPGPGSESEMTSQAGGLRVGPGPGARATGELS